MTHENEPPAGYPSPPPGQPGGRRVKVRPGRPWYLVSLALFLAGVAWLVLGFVLLTRQVDGFRRVPLPQGGKVTLASGGYVIYYEGPGANSGGFIPSFAVRVAPASPGAVVGGIRPYRVSLTYGLGSHRGRAVLTVQITHSGTFAVRSPNPPPGTGSDLAIGPSVGGRIVAIVLPTVALILTGIGTGLALFVARTVLISRCRRAPAAGQPS